MAEQLEAPTVPPISGWFKVVKKVDGSLDVQPSEALYKFIIGERGRVTNVNSGVSDALAAAAAAQGTANGAVAGVGNLAAQTLAFSGTVAPTSGAHGSEVGPAPDATVVTNSVTVTPVGGTGPYTYAWVITGTGISITSNTSATTTFKNIGVLAVDEFRSEYATCTITDSLLATAEVVCPVSLYGSFDPGI
jgi:hypothetical protein